MATMALLSSVFRWLLSSVLDQNLVQKRASLERKSKSEFARLVFLFDPERSTFGPDLFCSKDHSFRFIRSVIKRLRRPCAQIINKLIYKNCLLNSYQAVNFILLFLIFLTCESHTTVFNVDFALKQRAVYLLII